MLHLCDEDGWTSPSQAAEPQRARCSPVQGCSPRRDRLVWWFVLISHPNLAVLIPALPWLVHSYPGTGGVSQRAEGFRLLGD